MNSSSNGTSKTVLVKPIITQSSDFFKYQVNERINTTTAKNLSSRMPGTDIKAGLVILIKKFNFNGGTDKNGFKNNVFWETKTGNIQDVFEEARIGHTIRPGIKVGGNEKHHVTESYYLLVDIDNEVGKKIISNPKSYKETTATKWGVFANFWYPSPRYTEENQKHRLGFQFDRAVTPSEHETIGKYLKDTFSDDGIEIDPSCFDAGRLFYGSARKDLGEFFGNDKLPVEMILEEARGKDEGKYFSQTGNKIEKLNSSKCSATSDKTNVRDNGTSSKCSATSPQNTEKTSSRNQNSGSITDNVLNYIYEEIFVKKLNYDVAALYNIFPHELQQIEPDEVDMIDKYQGSNPFSPSNSSGTSFVVCCWDKCLPAFVDRSKNFTRKKLANGKFQSGGTFIDYFVFANKIVNNLYQNISDRNSLVGKNFRDIVSDICNYFGVKEFDFKLASEEDSLKITKKFVEHMKGKMFNYLGNNKLTSFFVFNENFKKWHLIINKNTFSSEIIQPWLVTEYGEDSQIADSLKLSKEITNYCYAKYRDSFLEMTEKLENLSYLPMQNGLYDIATGDLVPNEGQMLNRSVSVFSRKNVTEENQSVQIFKKWMKAWLKTDEKVDLVISWFSLVCQRQAYQTGNMFGFIGKSGMGKTTATSYLQALCNGFSAAPNVSTFTNTNNTHGRTVVENKQALFFEELTTKSKDSHSLEVFKDITGRSGKDTKYFLTINPKGEAEREIDARFSVTFNCQDVPKGLNDDGHDRRAIFLMLTEENHSPEGFALQEQITNFESYEDIFNWLISLKTEEMIETFNKIKRTDMILENTIKVRNEEPLPQFIIENLVVTNDDDDKVGCKEMYSLFTSYIIESGDYKMSRTRFIKEINRALNSKSQGFKWAGAKKAMRINGMVTEGFTGLRFKVETDVFQELA